MRLRALTLSALLCCVHAPLLAQSEVLRTADEHYQARRFEEAARIYREVLAADSTSALAHYRMGVIAREGKRYDESIRSFQAAQRHGFQPAFAILGIAGTLAERGDHDAAIDRIEALVNGGFTSVNALTQTPSLQSLQALPRMQQLVQKATRLSEPCRHSPEARQLDFWIGSWDVFDPRSGVQLGRNEVEPMLKDCALMENWTDMGGSSGKSLNFFEPQRRTWRQVWIAENGNVTDYREGEFRDNAMRFIASSVNAQGDSTLTRLTFFKVAADTVRQVFESSADRGQTWTTTWQGLYVRRKP